MLFDSPWLVEGPETLFERMWPLETLLERAFVLADLEGPTLAERLLEGSRLDARGFDARGG